MRDERSTVYFIPENIPGELKSEMERKILRGSSPGWTFTVSKFDPGDDDVLQGCTFLAETGMSNYYWNNQKRIWVDEDGSSI